jgi:hypothetical protein
MCLIHELLAVTATAASPGFTQNQMEWEHCLNPAGVHQKKTASNAAPNSAITSDGVLLTSFC